MSVVTFFHFLSWVNIRENIRENWEKNVKYKIRFKGTQEIEEDITEFARELVAMVERLAMRWKYIEKNFKVNNLVDILRESKNKKVLGSNWNEDPAYGLGKGTDSFTAKDCLNVYLAFQSKCKCQNKTKFHFFLPLWSFWPFWDFLVLLAFWPFWSSWPSCPSWPSRLEELHLREERNNWISGPTCCIH